MPWLFFSPSGRISRRAFLLGWLFWVAVTGFVIARMMANEQHDAAFGAWTVALVAIGMMSVVSTIMITVKRLHDIGFPGALAICMLIPVLSPFLFLALCLWPGYSVENNNGA